MTKSAAESLKLKTWEEMVTIKVLDKATCAMKKNCKVDLLSLDNIETQFLDRRAILVDKIPIHGDVIPRQSYLLEFEYLQGISLFEPPHYWVDVIISIDFAATWCVPRDFRRGLSFQPIAILSYWGWTLLGGDLHSSSILFNFLIRMDKDILAERLDKIFTEDFKSIPGDYDLNKLSREENRALTSIQESLHLYQQRYVASAPWKRSREETFSIMCGIDSRKTAQKRLESLGRRMNRDEDFKDKFFRQLTNLIAKGYVERVPLPEVDNPRSWYSPLHPVIKPRKPDKVRVTHDASAVTGGFALNDFLLKGPDFTCKLIAVIMRARIHPIFLKCDVKDFFMRVLMAEEDKDAFRFLFWADETRQEIVDWRANVWLFGLLSSPCIANLALRQCAIDNGTNFDAEVRRAIEESTYVDDCFRSLPDVESALKLLRQLPRMLAKGGFALAKMVSNSAIVMKEMAEEDRVEGVVHFQDAVLGEDSALGMKLDLNLDAFKPAFAQEVLTRPVATRREMLAVVASVWLPLGLFLPFVVPAKSIIQQLAALKLGWDDTAPVDIIDEFNEWRKGLQGIEVLEVPRWIQWKTGHQGEVHIFSDAALRLYGAVAYLRTVDSKGDVRVSLLMAKARVFPLNERQSGLHGSMPKRELMGALLATELHKILKDILQEVSTTFFLWTDSFAVQRWCFNEDLKLETFVANRVTKILDCFPTNNLRWVDGTSNPADQLSRGIHGGEKGRWEHFVQGPAWLSRGEEFWPRNPSIGEIEEGHAIVAACAEVNTASQNPKEVIAGNVIQELANKTNSFNKIIHGVIFLRRFMEKVVNRLCLKKGEDISFPMEEERNRAIISVLKYIQSQHFSREIAYFESCRLGRIKKNLGYSPLRALSPFLGKDGLLRIGGRLGDRIDSPHPIILPREREVVGKLLYQIHADHGHVGAATTHHICRKSYWVLQGGAASRSAVTNCLPCKKRFKSPGFQQMAAHPLSRCVPAYPFEATGVDLAGPYSLRSSAGRTTVKRWLSVFTCLRCRAIHVEVVEKLTKESFLCALVRFHARRNAVRTLWSDNGTNFVGASHELHSCLQEWAQQSTVELQRKGLQWTFAPAKAPEWGGAYERMIGMFKRVFAGVVEGSQLTIETFHTFAVATEGIINNRPLIPVPSDRRDHEALSPLSFLCPGVLATSSVDVLPPMPLHQLPLARSWHFVRGLLDNFWKRWTRDYLTLLQNRRKWSTIQRNLHVGDVVLLVDRQTPRDQWPLRIVIDTVLGEDNLVRRVSVKTAKSPSLDRHVAHVVLLEATPDEEIAEDKMAKSRNSHPLVENSSSVTPEEGNEKVASAIDSAGSLIETPSIPTTSTAVTLAGTSSTLDVEEDERTRLGVPLRLARLAHPHGT